MRTLRVRRDHLNLCLRLSLAFSIFCLYLAYNLSMSDSLERRMGSKIIQSNPFNESKRPLRIVMGIVMKMKESSLLIAADTLYAAMGLLELLK